MGAVACGVLLGVAMFTSVCEISVVRVEGNANLPAEQVKEISGVDGYVNLVTLPVGRLARNLLDNPWVADVEVERHLLHTVTIRIRERRPLAMLYCSGATFLVDDSGFVLAAATEDQMPELTRIYGGDMPPPVPGDTVSVPEVKECLKILASMPDGTRGIMQFGNRFDGRGQVFAARGGFNVVYGSARSMDEKSEVLQAILKDLEKSGRRIAYVDVRIPHSPVIMPI